MRTSPLKTECKISGWLWLPLIFFLIHYLATAFLSRFATDDFEFINKLHEHGFTGSVRFFYDTWSVRWASIGLMNIFLLWAGDYNTTFHYSLPVIVAFIIVTARLLHIVFSVQPSLSVPLSGYLIMTMFYTCFNIGETWFWINSSVTYLVATICLIAVLGELLSEKINWISWIIIILSAGYIGGSYEPMSFVVMCCAGAFLLFRFRLKGPVAAAEPAVIKSIILLSVLMIAFAVSFAGEGHKIRSTFLPDTTFLYKLWAYTKSMIKITLIFGPWKLLLSSFFIFPFYLLARSGKLRLPFQTGIVLASILLVLLLALSYLPIVFVMSEMGPERAWMQVTLYLTFFAAFVAVRLGEMHRDKPLVNPSYCEKAFAGLTIILVVIAAVNLRKDFIYVRAYELRMQRLEALANSQEEHPAIIELNPLPEPGLLKSAEISTHPDGAFNHFLAEYFKLNSKLRTAEVQQP